MGKIQRGRRLGTSPRRLIRNEGIASTFEIGIIAQVQPTSRHHWLGCIMSRREGMSEFSRQVKSVTQIRRLRHRRRFPSLARIDHWIRGSSAGWWTSLLSQLRTSNQRRRLVAVPMANTRRVRPLRRRPALGLEPLEPRQLLSVNTTFVNDNWRFVSDNDSSASLTAGDTVDNFSDDSSGAILKTYGVDAFGTVTTGAFTGAVLGAATINDAIANTDSGGTVQLLAGTYIENVDASAKSITLSLGPTPEQVSINGNLTLNADDSLAVKINGTTAGSQYDQLLVLNGNVTLSNPTLTATVGYTPTFGNSVAPLFYIGGGGALRGRFSISPPAVSKLVPRTLSKSVWSKITRRGRRRHRLGDRSRVGSSTPPPAPMQRETC